MCHEKSWFKRDGRIVQVDVPQRLCLFRRMATDVQEGRMTADELRRARDEIRRTRRAVLGEAEQLCADIVRHYPAGERSSVIATMYVEARSMSIKSRMMRPPKFRNRSW